jgi:hypothetical protein
MTANSAAEGSAEESENKKSLPFYTNNNRFLHLLPMEWALVGRERPSSGVHLKNARKMRRERGRSCCSGAPSLPLCAARRIDYSTGTCSTVHQWWPIRLKRVLGSAGAGG